MYYQVTSRSDSGGKTWHLMKLAAEVQTDESVLGEILYGYIDQFVAALYQFNFYGFKLTKDFCYLLS
jgi:hypothetical protein